MNSASDQGLQAALSRVRLFLALSRTPHGLLDMATPALGALLWLGAFPPLKILVLGLITAFAGYTAVYALNDVMDHRVDREKIRQGGLDHLENYVDALMVRHPIAQGRLSPGEGVLWVTAWAFLALIGAYLLNPVCVIIFVMGCFLEAVYCLLLKVSHLRAVVHGLVKTTGAVAAVFAVDPNPSSTFLILLFLWIFLWEIGGQNIPGDWADMEQDRNLEARTIPVRFGPHKASILILGSLLAAVALSVVIAWTASARLGLYYVAACLLAGILLLLFPACRLYRTKEGRHAMSLFTTASFYPLALLILLTVRITFRL